MPQITYSRRPGWQSYHKTLTRDIAEYGVYAGLPDRPCEQGWAGTGPQLFRATRDPLHGFIAKAVAQHSAGGMIGKGWSFADLAGTNDLEVDLQGLRGCALARAEDLHPGCTIPPDLVALVSGGTTLRCLADWAAGLAPRRSIMTSGTHLGPTVAGGFATASHGSRLGFGGLQDMIHGMHLIVSATESVWIERAGAPVLTDAAALEFATRVIRSDAMFEDALIHLGAMGIVNGVAIRLVPHVDYHVMAVVEPLWPEWMEQVEQGRFAEIARRLGHDDEPVFYEATIDPFDDVGDRRAIHLMYFVAPETLMPVATTATPPMHAADAIVAYARKQLEKAEAGEPLVSGGDAFSAFSIYQDWFDTEYALHKPPITPQSPRGGWEAIHNDDITGDHPGALYNASYAVRREETGRAFEAILRAASSLSHAQSFLYTFRFVTRPSGTLAFTRFDENCVIEIDGVGDHAPGDLPQLAQFTKEGARRIRIEFDAPDVRLDYSMHWGKLGPLDAAKVAQDFGPADDPASPIGRWRATRALLLGPDERVVFVNAALRAYGLLP